MDTATVKASTKLYNITLPSDIIFTKDDTSTIDEQVEKLNREFNIHYRACIVSLIYFHPTRVDFSLVVHKVAIFLENPGKVYFVGLVHLLKYIRENKTLGLKYYVDVNDAPVYDLLRQSSIRTENHLMNSSDSSWQVCPYTGRCTWAYIIFFHGGPIENSTHVPGPVAHSNEEIEEDEVCTAGMD